MTQTRPISKSFHNLPTLGVGLGFRSPYANDVLAASNELINWLEITPENYMGRGGKQVELLESIAEKFPLISHGVALSLGSTDEFSKEYLRDLSELLDWIKPHWFSDHLSFSSINNRYFNDLIPLPKTEETIQYLVDRIKFVQDYFQRPFLIENISYYLSFANDCLPDEVFISEIVEQADCGLLLDINNVYVNSQNHNLDPIKYLSNIPLNRVVQIHIAGHTHYSEAIIDTHGDKVCDRVWELLEWTLKRTSPAGVMLERDLNLPPFDEIENELKKLQEIWNNSQKQSLVTT